MVELSYLVNAFYALQRERGEGGLDMLLARQDDLPPSRLVRRSLWYCTWLAKLHLSALATGRRHPCSAFPDVADKERTFTEGLSPYESHTQTL
jgi:hypothetical protein